MGGGEAVSLDDLMVNRIVGAKRDMIEQLNTTQDLVDNRIAAKDIYDSSHIGLLLLLGG